MEPIVDVIPLVDEGLGKIAATAVLVHCGHGERAMSAASLLQRTGRDDVAVLAGGLDELGELETGAGT
jgi:rhodanese-related sulfurtransferase